MSSKNKMVYEWDQKRDECYVMYITQNRSLDEIIDFYRERNFAPRYVVVDSTGVFIVATVTSYGGLLLHMGLRGGWIVFSLFIVRRKG